MFGDYDINILIQRTRPTAKRDTQEAGRGVQRALFYMRYCTNSPVVLVLVAMVGAKYWRKAAASAIAALLLGAGALAKRKTPETVPPIVYFRVGWGLREGWPTLHGVGGPRREGPRAHPAWWTL